MTKRGTLRVILKRYLPSPIRKILRMIAAYFQRVGRWTIILVQMRGVTISDQLKLFGSALASLFNSFIKLDSWQDPKLLSDIEVVVFNIGQFKLRKQTDDLWHVLPWRERAVLRELYKRLKPGSTFVDAGANIGIYTVLASRLVGTEGEVISIEMIPSTAAILQHHIALNNCGNVKLIENALSDRVGDTVVANIPQGKYGQASIAKNRKTIVGEQVNIKTTTLDEICEHGVVIDLIKMDIEGVEALALTGAAKTLQRTQSIIFETIRMESDEASKILMETGFKLHYLSGRDQLALRAMS